MNTAVLCTPLRVEQAALRRAGRRMRLIRTGMGPQRAAATAATLPPTAPVLVAGVAAAKTPQLHPGDVVVATEVRSASVLATPELAGHVEIPSAPLLAAALRGLGLRVHLGAISSVPRIAWRPVTDGAIAVDMESAQLAVTDRPCAVVRVIVDTPDHPLWHVGTLRRGMIALRTLRACRPALEWWAAATGPREIRLATPGTDDFHQMDLVLAIGTPSLMELAQREGVPAHLINEVSEIDLRWLAGRTRLAIIAGAATSPHLVEQIVHCLGGLGPVTVREADVTREVS